MGLIQKIAYILGRRTPSERCIEKIRSGGGIVGNNVQILNSSIDLRIPSLLIIGNDVTITGATLLTHDASTKTALGYTKFGNIIIGNNVFIGIGAIILPNTTIGDDVVIGAGCVVAKNIPSNSIVVGNPGKVICTYKEYINEFGTKIDEGSLKVFKMYPKEIVESKKEKTFIPANDIFFTL